jgi:hypothetical protein
VNSKPCPIPGHKNSTTCCGRGEQPARAGIKQPKWKYIGPGIRQYPDGHIERTPAALKRRKDELLRQSRPCAACDQHFTDYRDVELGHVRSKGSGGWKRDDSDLNISLLHKGANRAQGSLDLDIYLANYWKPEHCGIQT